MSSSDLASKLVEFEGRRVTRLTRHSWWSVDKATSECSIRAPQVFSLTCGPLELEFDGCKSLMIASDPSVNGIVVWDKLVPDVTEDEVGYLLPAEDKHGSESRWAILRNRPIRFIEILKPLRQTPKQATRPSEVGVIFWFHYGRHIVASHGLHDGSDDFSVLQMRDLAPGIREHLMAVRVGGERRTRGLQSRWF